MMKKLALVLAALCASCGGRVAETSDGTSELASPPAAPPASATSSTQDPRPPVASGTNPFVADSVWRGGGVCDQPVESMELHVSTTSTEAVAIGSTFVRHFSDGETTNEKVWGSFQPSSTVAHFIDGESPLFGGSYLLSGSVSWSTMTYSGQITNLQAATVICSSFSMTRVR